MAKVRQDKKDLYIICGGYICRPTRDTKFNVGDNVPARHIGGSDFITIGKGVDKETWRIIDGELSPAMMKSIAEKPKPILSTVDMRKELARLQIDTHKECQKILMYNDQLKDSIAVLGNNVLGDLMNEIQNDIDEMEKNIDSIK